MRTIAAALLFLCGCVSHPLIPPLKEPAGAALSGAAPQLSWPSAHRANPGGFADNSIEGISAAVALGIPLLEVDPRMNRNGTVFLFHDGTLRPGNFSGSKAFFNRHPESLSDAELSELSVAGGSHSKVPLFGAALEILRGKNSLLELDVKHESETVVRTILQIASSSGLEDLLLIQAEHPETIELINSEYPKVKTSFRCKSKDGLKAAIALHPTVVELEGWHDSEAILELHANRIRVLVNVAESAADNPTTWKDLFDLGVDVIMTDNARKMVDWLQDRQGK